MAADKESENDEFRRKLRGAVGDMQQNLKNSAVNIAATAAINGGPDAFASYLSEIIAEGKPESAALLFVQLGIGVLDEKAALEVWQKLPLREEEGGCTDGSRGLSAVVNALGESSSEEKGVAAARVARFLSGARERDEATQILERVAEELGEAAEEEEGGEKREGAQRGLWQVL